MLYLPGEQLTAVRQYDIISVFLLLTDKQITAGKQEYIKADRLGAVRIEFRLNCALFDLKGGFS